MDTSTVSSVRSAKMPHHKEIEQFERPPKPFQQPMAMSLHIKFGIPYLVIDKSLLDHCHNSNSVVPTSDMSPPYVNSGTTFFQKYLIKHSIINLPSK